MNPPTQRPVSAVRALLLGVGAVGAKAGPALALISAFAAESLVDVGAALALLALLTRGGGVGGAALGGLFTAWLLARLARYFVAGGLLGSFAARQRGTPVGFAAAARALALRSVLAFLGTLLVEAFLSAWRWVALSATGVAFVVALVKQQGGVGAAFGLALCSVVLLALALFGRLWVEAAFAASVIHDAPFSASLRRAAGMIAARPFAYLGLLLTTGFIAGMVEVGVTGGFSLFTAGKLAPAALLSLTLATRAAGALLTAFPSALAWGGRVGAFAALELDARGELPPPPAKPTPAPIPMAQLVPDAPPPTSPANDLA